MKFIIGFFMAWGNFITLPCPYKRWNNDYKNIMLSFLPMIGAVIGSLWVLLAYLTVLLKLPSSVGSLLMIFYIFNICGFMHMDGFMDCNDAILSRRPLEDRQRILKDSTVGAFAVVTLAFLLLGWYASFSAITLTSDVFGPLFIIPVASRAVSGYAVLGYKPIGHSQYVNDFKAQGKWKYRLAIALQLIVISLIISFVPGNPYILLSCIITTVVFGLVSCKYARVQLGGMSGDVAGYMICIGELAGILSLAITQNLL